jgi:superfamily II DNA/RNA helicase
MILASKTTPEDVAADEPVDITFAELGLDPKIQKALDDMGYVTPTPIQARAIPSALEGRDVLGIAQTGTGKTAAFTLPTIHKMARGRARARMPRCLIICPTRELAAQVAENVELYGKYLKLEMALIIGGVSFAEQEKKLMKGVDVLIATPGRLLDQFDRGKILLTGVQTLVVDEADRMLDMGFIPDIERIFKLTPFTRQVLFFSATMPNEIKRLVEQFLHQPVTVQVARQSQTADTVTQRIVRMPTSDHKQKRTALRWVIDNESVKNGIVFCNRKRDVDIVAKSLSVHGHSAAPIHGDLPQSVRTETLAKFKNGDVKLLVASDVAARGLDIPSVSHVLNYDVPSHSEDYVHRIGRTGRAGRKGDTVMFVTRLDDKYYNNILSLIKLESIEELEIPGIDDFPTDRGGSRRGSDRKRRGASNRRDGGKNRSRRSEKSTPDKKDRSADQKLKNKPAKKDKKAKESESRQNPKKSKSKAKTESRDKSKKRDRNGLKENTKAGFGDDMPAFFSSTMKN